MDLNDTKRSLLIAQDIRLVKALAGNNNKLRDRALKSLRKWLEHRSLKIPFTEQEFIRIWKGLFYAMWMSDKPLMQEECAENIAHLLHFKDIKTSLLFFKCSLIVLATEWFGIDQLRLDKFLMFVRRILRQALFVLKNNNWQFNSIIHFGEILYETVLQNDYNNHIGLTMHIIEIYLEELAKVSKGEIDKSLMIDLLRPFVKLLATLRDTRLIAHMNRYLFYHLLRQTDEGIEYQVKFQAWKGEGFPGGTIDSMKKVRDIDNDITFSDEEIDNQHLDPRAGEVDVVLPQLRFNAKQVAKLLLEFKFANGSNTKSRKAVTELVKKFQQLSKGNFPLGIKKIQLPEDDGYSTNIRKSVNRLVKFEKHLLGSNRKRKLKLKKRNDSLNPSKKIKVEQMNLAKSDSNDFQKKLDHFIRKSEGSKIFKVEERKNIKKERKHQKITKRKEQLLKIFCKNYPKVTTLRANSGMWLIDSLDDNTQSDREIINYNSTTDNKLDSLFSKIGLDFASKRSEICHFEPVNSLKSNNSSTIFPPSECEYTSTRSSGSWVIEPLDRIKTTTYNSIVKNDSAIESALQQPHPKLSPVKDSEVLLKLTTSPKSTRTGIGYFKHNSIENIKLDKPFPQNDWDSAPKEGEVEFFVPSNKFKRKIENIAKKSGKVSSLLLLKQSIDRLDRPRYSLDSNLVKNPFSHKKVATPRSEKKVKINLKLNSSQEIYEHRAQLLQSPAIPFDANKKPNKPLLKSNIKSPINPFAKQLFT